MKAEPKTLTHTEIFEFSRDNGLFMKYDGVLHIA